ncbi:hypothetical protein NC653_030699 [Populus alba x Populus x berolinensis]|uniref:Uncharacterized protein n=1 Tax=Populus alba x Populus x berolinensis TaxID=444605 RepID=A0AAD6LWM0_9ROSI|nr:hypothetical protein NC653_030699 [Populus alba x Populus x berolinensis]
MQLQCLKKVLGLLAGPENYPRTMRMMQVSVGFKSLEETQDVINLIWESVHSDLGNFHNKYGKL